MITLSKNELMAVFNDPTFAWELLQWEIAIEMNESLSGQGIARLLQLYMRGVQKMNSLMDVRQSYFKNKVTSLMMRGNVVKTLNKPPMAKKEKPLEAIAKTQPQIESKQTVLIGKNVKQPEKKQGKGVNNNGDVKINTFALQQKKRQIQMRLAYEAQQTNRQHLNNMYSQHIKKEQKYLSKVSSIINDHQERLKERINRRKLKTATYRSRPDDTNDTFSKQLDLQEGKKQEETFSSNHGNINQAEIKSRHRFKSLQTKAKHDMQYQQSPKKARKLTLDLTHEEQDSSGKVFQREKLLMLKNQLKQ